jgi:hypothetical protein
MRTFPRPCPVPLPLAVLLCFALPACSLNQRWQVLPPSPGDKVWEAEPPRLSPQLQAALSSGRHFPDDIDYLIHNAYPGWVESVEGELVKAGAHVDPDGQLYDAENKGIYLWIWPPGGGCQRSEADLQQERERMQRALQDARQRYRVIEILHWDGPLPP